MIAPLPANQTFLSYVVRHHSHLHFLRPAPDLGRQVRNRKRKRPPGAMKYRAQFYYPMGRRWVTIKTSKYYEKVREALHRFWQGCKLYETRIITLD